MQRKRQNDALYTRPSLRERIHQRLLESDKGGRPGQWSARKSQMLAREYKRSGGGYRKQGLEDRQRHLVQWGRSEKRKKPA